MYYIVESGTSKAWLILIYQHIYSGLFGWGACIPYEHAAGSLWYNHDVVPTYYTPRYT